MTERPDRSGIIHEWVDKLAKSLPHSEKQKLPLADLPKLTSYAVESRYPGDWDPITEVEATEALRIANQVRSAIRKALGL